MAFREEDQKQNREAKRKDVLDYLNRRNIYAKCFGSDAGREVLMDQIECSHILTTPFTNNNITTFSLGQQQKLLEIASYIPGIFGECLFRYCQKADELLIKELEDQRKQFDL